MKRSQTHKHVVFVGDKSSSKNLNEFVPFVGTPSYKKLLSWIADLDLLLSQIRIINSDHEETFTEDLWLIVNDIGNFDRIKFVALGKNASKMLNKNNLEHFILPHPSPKNRLLNDKKLEKKLIKSCYKFLRTYV